MSKMFQVRGVHGVFRIFFTEGALIFVTFSSVVFLADLILSNVSFQNDSRGSGGMLLRKILENLRTTIAILVIFERFLRKV